MRELYEQAHRAVFGFALSILKHPHDAQDVMQDTFLRARAGAARYEPRGKPLAWLLTIARNLALQKLRARRGEADWEQVSESLAALPRVTNEDRLLLREALARLGDEERQVVTLHAVAGLKHREIAAVLSLPLSTVLSKYGRALKKLKKIMEEMDAP